MNTANPVKADSDQEQHDMERCDQFWNQICS